jgi:type I restriction enzyme S subunit
MREDWIECKFGDIITFKNGYAFKSIEYLKSGIPIIRIGDIKENEVVIENAVCTDENKDLKEYEIVKNDILIAMSGATTGKFGRYNHNGKAYLNQRVGNIKPLSDIYICKSFLYYLLSQLKREIERSAYGGAQPNISSKKIEELAINFAPLPEQRAIVKKLESLFSSLDAGVADLKKAQQQLKIYRQAVLKKAFEGELTKEWREKHSYNMDDFLQELKNKKNTAIKEKLISKGDYFPNYKSENLNFITPSNWLSLPWKTLTSNRKYALKRGPFGSALKKDFFVKSGTVVYEQGHAINDDPYRHRYFITSEKFEELKAFAVGAGDLIISCSGATLGRICLLPEDAEVGVINQALLKVDLDEEVIIKKYFLILFRSESFQRLIFSKALGSAMPNMVGMEELKEMPIPIPSILEQKEIVKQIESRLSVCNSIEENIKESLEKAEALRQSILKKAFEGNLLTEQELAACRQAEDYQPASVLLERIQAAQTDLKTKPAKKKVVR